MGGDRSVTPERGSDERLVVGVALRVAWKPIRFGIL